MSAEYIPGTCNLGKSEVRRRQIVALIGAAFSISSGVTLASSDVSTIGKFSVFLPLMVFAIGFVQSRKKFCLAYGLAGTFNLGKMGEISKVQNPADRAADRKTALVILAQSAALALALTLAFVIATR
ncbi:MAG: hypothetical protein D4R85_03250 [Streptomycetaceae bacterium]|nr:hypothetical protein [Actinomycetota bacterium]TRZ84959.1 MAG: hypothetical protein D4R85_03250 [Streptomycetaceae bacterium]